MTVTDLAAWLIEQDDRPDNPADERVKVYVDRLMLRVLQVPALLSYLKQVHKFQDGANYVVELVFKRFPAQMLDTIQKLIGADRLSVFSFEKDGAQFIGCRIKLTPVDLGLRSVSGRPV